MTRVSRVVSLILVLLVGLSISPILRAQSGLERKVETLFLARHQTFSELKAKLEELGREGGVDAVLISMLAKHGHAVEGTLSHIYLDAATAMVGELKLKAAGPRLQDMLFDPREHENVRARAAKSLGQIDPESNKEVLLKALADASDYFAIRIYAAEGLAKTRDSNALRAEQHSREERDNYVRQQFEKAAKTMRANGVRP